MIVRPLFPALIAIVFLFPFPAAGEDRKRPRPIISPTMEGDRITFLLREPSANEVLLTGQMVEGGIPLERGEDDVWSVTLEDLEPGVYEYGFVVDGVRMLDPGNPSVKPSRNVRTSILCVEGENPHDFLDVPHGTVHQHAYRSGPIDRFREMRVYTPPGYETGDESYPLLVLQHGHSDTYAAWTTHGKAHWILDNLISGNQAEPMIIVMLDGHPIPESYGAARSTENTEELRQDLVDEVLPMVEKLYRVGEGREQRAIAGLSMGGLHSLTIGLNELETFAWIGAFSAAIPERNAIESALESAENTNEQLNLFWIACGEDDFLLEENREFIETLEEAGIAHEWILTEGDHSWPVWRGYLADFVARLFR